MLCVVFRLSREAKSGGKSTFHHGDVSASQGADPGTGKQRIDVVGILTQPPVCLAHRLIGQREDLVAHGGIFFDGVPAGEKSVIGVEGGIEEIEPVKLLEDARVEQIGGGLRIAWMFLMVLLKLRDGVGEIEVVKAVVSRAHLRVVVHGIGVQILGRGHHGRE